jgi:phage gpG-like protein
MVSLEVDLDVSELESAIDRYGLKGKQLHDLGSSIAQMMLLAVEDNFESQGQGNWPGLSDETLRQRRASESPKMLQDSGVMVGSLQPRSELKGVGVEASVSTNVPYAGFHVGGTGNMPARDFLDIDMARLSAKIEKLVFDVVTS